MRVAITGSSGLIGTALAESLRADGHQVLRLVRRPAAAPDEVQWDPGRPLDPGELAGVTGAVNLAGAGLGDRRWTESYKRTVIDSRLHSTRTLATALAELEPRPGVLVSQSGIDYYPSSDAEVDETDEPGTGFLSDLCQGWEAATAPAQTAGIQVAHSRTGLVISGRGGAFGRRMIPLFKLGLGGKLGSGRQYWSFVSLNDEVRALRFLLENEIAGPVNLSAPNPVTNAEVTRVLGSALRRPTLLPAPAFGMRLVLGEFAAAPLASHRVLPRVLEQAGFTFAHPTIETAVRAALG